MNSADDVHVSWAPIIVSIIGLVLALGDWPYVYYVMLRFCICASAAYLGFCAKEVGRPVWQWIMWGIAVWFNPVLPIHMNRSDWQAVDVIAVIPFLMARFAIRRRQNPRLWWIVGGIGLSAVLLIFWGISTNRKTEKESSNPSIRETVSEQKTAWEESTAEKPEFQSENPGKADSSAHKGQTEFHSRQSVQNQSANLVSISSLTAQERQSLESACSSSKVLEGPAAYNRCVQDQLAALSQGTRRPDLSGLSRQELESIESACSSSKVLEGPASYNQCLQNQLGALSRSLSRPDLSGLSRQELESIESACSSSKVLEGPAAYNQCLQNQLAALSHGIRRPDLSGLSRQETESIESACSSSKVLKGPAAYNQCLQNQLTALSRGPRRPDLSSLSRQELESIESACSSSKVLQGPAAYNRCLIRQLERLNDIAR